MFREDMWPFTPMSLSEILERETLSVLVTGCRERLGRDLVLIDADTSLAPRQRRIDSFLPKQYYQDFCELVRSPVRVEGGDEACSQCDLAIASKQMAASDPGTPQFTTCHMGLLDSACSIIVHGQQLAVLIAGQFRPLQDEEFQKLKENIGRLERGEYSTMQVLDEDVGLDLLPRADQLIRPPASFQNNILREVEHITAIATAEFERCKALWEQDLMKRMRNAATDCTVENLADIGEMTRSLLTLIRGFCRCDYALFFANIRERETVLSPIGHAGVDTALHDQLPHFNWRRANMPMKAKELVGWDIRPTRRTVGRGVRGDEAAAFADISCIIPATLGEMYRGVLVLGPFTDLVDLDMEYRFLTEVARSLSRYVLTELQMLSLVQQQNQWRSTAQLITHQVRTTLMSIMTQVGTAQLLVERSGGFPGAERATDVLHGAEALGMHLGRATAETLNSHVLHMEREDFTFDIYPLSVLTANCAENYADYAEERSRVLQVDDSIEMLPTVEVDIARFTIVLSNIIENAIKYSFPRTTIIVRRGTMRDHGLNPDRAIIEVEDLGHMIPPEERQRIFEQGRRGVVGTRANMIHGSGLGLWEAQAVVQAHGGTIQFTTRSTRHYHQNVQGHVVIFVIEIPLRQE